MIVTDFLDRFRTVAVGVKFDAKNVTIGAAVAVSVFTAVGVTNILLLRRISQSVGIEAPTDKQLSEEAPDKNCPLFRHFPSLSTKLAWRSLGVTCSTPIHVCTLPAPVGNNNSDNDKKSPNPIVLKFYVKREDLIHPSYGGNKVRTLQHMLGVLEARRDRGSKACRHIVSLGSGGSNQVIATVVHGNKLGWNNKSGDTTGDSDDKCTINACWFDSDEPDLDNTLNMLSVLSFPNVGYCFDWGMAPSAIQFVRAIAGVVTQRDFIPLMLGGNCTAGVLGQASGVLELAEQIEVGECPDVDRIYLPIGSGCTVSGLILGSVMVRYMNMKALSNPDFKIVGCNVHDGFAAADRLFSLHTNPLLGFIPLTITYSVLNACRALKALGGPDLEDGCRTFIKSNVELRADGDVVGKYGTHSDETRSMAHHYDEQGKVTDLSTGKTQKELWVCGHFVAKALHPLIKDLEEATTAATKQTDTVTVEQPTYMLWQTKSATQPKGPLDEFERMKQRCNKTIKKWADDGKAESIKYRPGSVNIDYGKPEDYQSIMTEIKM